MPPSEVRTLAPDIGEDRRITSIYKEKNPEGCARNKPKLVEAGGIEPHFRVTGQGLTPCCDEIVTIFGRRRGRLQLEQKPGGFSFLIIDMYNPVPDRLEIRMRLGMQDLLLCRS